MTGGTAHPTKITTPITPLDADMTALTIGAKVGKNSRKGFFFTLVNVGFGDLCKFGWKIIGIGSLLLWTTADGLV